MGGATPRGASVYAQDVYRNDNDGNFGFVIFEVERRERGRWWRGEGLYRGVRIGRLIFLLLSWARLVIISFFGRESRWYLFTVGSAGEGGRRVRENELAGGSEAKTLRETCGGGGY